MYLSIPTSLINYIFLEFIVDQLILKYVLMMLKRNHLCLISFDRFKR